MQKALLVLAAILCIAILFGQDEIEKITGYAQNELGKLFGDRDEPDAEIKTETATTGRQISAENDHGPGDTAFDPDPGYYSKGLVKAGREDYEGALSKFNKAIALTPENAWVYYDRGRVRFKLGDTQGACADWHKAGELGYLPEELIQKHCN